MKKKRTNLLIPMAVGLAALLFVTAGLLLYNQHIRRMVEQTTYKTLEESINQQIFNFTSKLEMEENAVRALATALCNSPNVKDIDPAILLDISEEASFNNALVANASGIALSNTGREIDISDRDYFQQSMAGATVMSAPMKSKIRDEEVVVISTPLIYQNDIVGVFVASYLANDLDNFLLPSFDGIAYAYVTTNEGEIIARSTNAHSITQSNNLFETYKTADFYAQDNFQTIQEKVALNESGQAKYIIGGQKRVMHYGGLGVNDWNIFVIVPEDVVFQTAGAILWSTTVLSVTFLVVFLLLLATIVLIQRRNMASLEKMAFVDDLTGAPTLVKFKLDASKLLSENPESKYVLIKIDINNFKLINQTLGFEVGNQVLKCMAKAAEICASGKRELYGRANIDEFVLLHEYRSEEHLNATLQHFKSVFLQMMASELGIHTVAEGVETKEHIDLLRELDCDMVQGYYYAKPMPEKDFDDLMKKRPETTEE